MTRESNVFQLWPARDNAAPQHRVPVRNMPQNSDSIYYLRSADFDAFEHALDNPPEPNEKLRTLLRSDNIRRVVPPSVISRHLGDDVEVVNLYQSLEDQARIAAIVAEIDAADARLRRMQRAVLWFCYFAAVFAGCLFAFQLGRGAF